MDRAFPLNPLTTSPANVVMFSPWPDKSFHDQAAQYVTGAMTRNGMYEKTKEPKWSAKHARFMHQEVYQGKAHKNPGQKTYHLRELSAGQNLEDLGEHDRLYIMGHGVEDDQQLKFPLIKGDYPLDIRNAPKGYYLYAPPFSKAYYPALIPEQLIEKLKEAKLPKHVRDIRLWVCNSGSLVFSTFAWEFTGLIRKTNKAAIVTAYSGFMNLTRIGHKTGDHVENNAGEGKAASKFRVIINNDQAFRNYEPNLNRQKLIEAIEQHRMHRFDDVQGLMGQPTDFDFLFNPPDVSNQLTNAPNHNGPINHNGPPNHNGAPNHNGVPNHDDIQSAWDALSLELHEFDVSQFGPE